MQDNYTLLSSFLFLIVVCTAFYFYSLKKRENKKIVIIFENEHREFLIYFDSKSKNYLKFPYWRLDESNFYKIPFFINKDLGIVVNNLIYLDVKNSENSVYFYVKTNKFDRRLFHSDRSCFEWFSLKQIKNGLSENDYFGISIAILESVKKRHSKDTSFCKINKKDYSFNRISFSKVLKKIKNVSDLLK